MINTLIFFSGAIVKSELRREFKASGCCPLNLNYNECAIIHMINGPNSGFTCEQAKTLYCTNDS